MHQTYILHVSMQLFEICFKNENKQATKKQGHEKVLTETYTLNLYSD